MITFPERAMVDDRYLYLPSSSKGNQATKLCVKRKRCGWVVDHQGSPLLELNDRVLEGLIEKFLLAADG